MSMPVSGIIGPQGWNNDGSSATRFRQDKTGAIVVSEYMGRYSEMTYRGQTFIADASQTLMTSLSTAYTAGLALSNDPGSGKNLHVLGVGFVYTTAPAGASIVALESGFSAGTATVHTTPGTVKSCLIGGVVGAGKVDTAATLSATPTLLMALTSLVAASAITPQSAPWIDLGGALIIPPGGFIAFYSITTAAVGHCQVAWAELPI